MNRILLPLQLLAFMLIVACKAPEPVTVEQPVTGQSTGTETQAVPTVDVPRISVIAPIGPSEKAMGVPIENAPACNEDNRMDVLKVIEEGTVVGRLSGLRAGEDFFEYFYFVDKNNKENYFMVGGLDKGSLEVNWADETPEFDPKRTLGLKWRTVIECIPEARDYKTITKLVDIQYADK